MKKDYSAANVVENTQLARTFETLSFEWVKQSHVANSIDLWNILKS